MSCRPAREHVGRQHPAYFKALEKKDTHPSAVGSSPNTPPPDWKLHRNQLPAHQAKHPPANELCHPAVYRIKHRPVVEPVCHRTVTLATSPPVCEPGPNIHRSTNQTTADHEVPRTGGHSGPVLIPRSPAREGMSSQIAPFLSPSPATGPNC